jgi:hypothetical protein
MPNPVYVHANAHLDSRDDGLSTMSGQLPRCATDAPEIFAAFDGRLIVKIPFTRPQVTIKKTYSSAT